MHSEFTVSHPPRDPTTTATVDPSRSAPLVGAEQSPTTDLLPSALLRREATVLVVESDPRAQQMIVRSIRDDVHSVELTNDMSGALARLRRTPFQVVVADAGRGDDRERRLQLCRYLAQNRPDTAVVVIADPTRMDAAIAAMRAGAFDLVNRPLRTNDLRHAVRRAASHALVEGRLHRLDGATKRIDGGPILGESPPVRLMLDQLARVAETDVTVLVTGESGTGKELVARALHERSPRRTAPFVPVNCAAIPSELLEAELFGHVRGAFTDARQAKDGLFVRAEGGTLFLDEVGDMPADMQVKLLRALQERSVRPVGASKETAVNVRIVAATNSDLEADVASGRFREDLYYRLNVVRIETPPLRERGEDILLLAQTFVARWAKEMGKAVECISAEAAQRLMEHHWPGNVRELDNVIQRAVALCRYDQIVPEDLGQLDSQISGLRAPPAPEPGDAAPPAPGAPVWATTPAPSTSAAGHAETPPLPDPGQTPTDSSPAESRERPDTLAALQAWIHRELEACAAQDQSLASVPALVEVEEVYIRAMLEICEGNKTRAATALGMARRTLYRRLKQMSPSSPESRSSPGPVVDGEKHDAQDPDARTDAARDPATHVI